ncbi:MAG TPA: hypothetical protein VEI08_01505 [Candidatus Bathyarchaeia archaeon]|nr:hypothetical protein [Candidatus Bathyarchaeia archaeon]
MSVHRLVLLALLLPVVCAPFGLPTLAQDDATPTEETVANLAAGRVVIAVVKNAILVATLENPIEAETRPPTPVPLSTARLGVLLGPVLWWSPSSKIELARLDQELPQLHSHLIANVPHLQADQGGAEATDMESIGQGLFERLNDVAQNLHSKIDVPPNEPLIQLVVADYLAGYGPEIWQLSFGIKQQEEQSGYWTTRVLHPAYLQFWPPEKGQLHTLVEFAYPPENTPPSLLDLLREKDPRLENILSADPKMAEVAGRFLQGDSAKVSAADATQFLRATLDAVAPPNAREIMASITEDNGFQWILAPPPEPKSNLQRSGRPADAPTLQKSTE